MDNFAALKKQPHTILTIDHKLILQTKVASPNQDKKALSNIITIFFKFAYYHGLSPFMIKDDSSKPVHVTWWFPKMVWIMNLVPCMLFRTAESRLILDFATDWNPAEYFRVFHALLKVVFHMTLWYYLWYKSEAYLTIVRFIHNSKNLPVPKAKILVKLLPLLLGVLFTVIAVILGTNSVTTLFNCSDSIGSDEYFGKVFRMWAERGKYALFLINKSPACEHINVNTSLSLNDIAIGIFSGVGILFRQVSGFCEELLLPSGICVFWLCSKEFSTRLTIASSSNQDVTSNLWEPIMAWYSSLKELSVLIKNAYADLLLYRLILLIFDVPITFGIVDNIADQIRFLIMFLASAGSFIVAADAHKQIQTFESWVSKMVALDVPWLSSQRLAMLLHELQTNSVGISLNVGFTITYSLVANASGVLITYFIICVQYRNSPNNKLLSE
ncbi:unnamed protein product [Orchesella dallaii]|uniref:Gustatory receptor n=1 Tax=Orchesella dallaii TaxID=48710 RepID=A0ABP1RG45_9HEXA